jgi:hypothetical protein
MTYFDNTLTIDKIEEMDSTPVLPEERHIFELIGFERSAPDQWRAEGGIKWTWLVYKEDGQPFIFQDEQYQFFRTTGLTRNGRPNFNVGTFANAWASALLGRDLGVDADFSIGDLHRKRMSAMVVWEPQKSDPKKKTIKLASLRHAPVAAGAARPAPGQVSSDPSDDEVDRALAVTAIKKSLERLKKIDPEAGAAAQKAFDDSDPDASVDELDALAGQIRAAVRKAMDD